MPKICLSADWHVSNFGPARTGPITPRGRDVLAVVRRTYELAMAQGADTHIGLGDIFDLDRPPPALIRGLQELVDQMPTWLLVGNHDQTSEAEGHHALAPMVPCAHVVEDLAVFQHGQCAVALVGFRQRERVIERVQGIVWPEGTRVLGVHLGVADDTTPHFLRDTRDSIALDTLVELAKSQGIREVFTGNWHNPDQWEVDGVRVWQVGGLSPHVFGERWDRDGRVLLLDTDSLEVEEAWIPGPRYVTITGSPPWDLRDLPEGWPLWLRFKVRAEHEEAAWSFGRTNTDISRIRVLVEPGEISLEEESHEDVGSAKDAALQMASELGGPELVDYVAECLTKSVAV